MMLSIIVAITENSVIGKDNSLIYKIEKDLKRFKEITQNHTIVMGRKTFESLPFVLPNRKHIVLTTNKDFKFIHKDVEIIHSIKDVITLYENSPEEVFVIGGEEIYNLLLPYSKKLYLTKIHSIAHGDAYFPSINYEDWKLSYIKENIIDKDLNLKFSFKDYIRK